MPVFGGTIELTYDAFREGQSWCPQRTVVEKQHRELLHQVIGLEGARHRRRGRPVQAWGGVEARSDTETLWRGAGAKVVSCERQHGAEGAAVDRDHSSAAGTVKTK